MTSGPSSVPDLDLPWAIDYRGLVTALEADGVSVADHLRVELPQTFLDVYADMTARPLNVMVFQHRTFSYVYDHYAALEATGAVVFDQNQESRLVGAVGVSAPHFRARDDSRLRGWVGPTGTTFGEGWDKGHFIGHAIGGAVDGLEANVFLQRSAVNRGPYLQMERYSAAHPGVLCFSRPIYNDGSSRPAAVEFGVLKVGGELWVRRFDNR